MMTKKTNLNRTKRKLNRRLAPLRVYSMTQVTLMIQYSAHYLPLDNEDNEDTKVETSKEKKVRLVLEGK